MIQTRLLAALFGLFALQPGPIFAQTDALVVGLPDFTKLVETQGAGVVNISTTQSVTPEHSLHGAPESPDSGSFWDFLQPFIGGEGHEEMLPEAESLGSGFFISEDGYVITNAHVVEDADEILVRTKDRREFIAELIGVDMGSDLALLKVDGTNLPALQAGSAKDLAVGEWVLAIGSPFGFEQSATAGIVSAKGRSLPTENYVPFIQTDVAINPGNSGGPLFGLDGKVVGVNSQIFSRTGGFMGLSFAVPIDLAMDVVEQLKAKGTVSRGWLGVLIQDVDRELAESFGMEVPRGALITQVLADSPAAAAGLEAGDVILTFADRPVARMSALPPIVGATPVGMSARVELIRNGERRELTVTIGELTDELIVARAPSHPTASTALGLAVADLDAQERAVANLDEGGVKIAAITEGPAQRAGLEAGDIIVLFDGQPVPGAAAFEEMAGELEPGRSIAILVQRPDGKLFMAMQVPE